jgi:ribosomal protein S18 acetylase RimI-like enzyme
MLSGCTNGLLWWQDLSREAFAIIEEHSGWLKDDLGEENAGSAKALLDYMVLESMTLVYIREVGGDETMAACLLMSDEMDDFATYIVALGVSGEHRGKRLGQHLLKAAMGISRRSDFFAMIRSTNKASLKCFYAQGFSFPETPLLRLELNGSRPLVRCRADLGE